MEWRIESPSSLPPSGLRAALEAALAEWVKTTPQTTRAESREYGFIDQLIASKYNAERAAPVAEKAAMVAADAATLDVVHTNIVRQMRAGIVAACALADSLPEGACVRASVSGHFMPGHDEFIDERLSVDVDQCRPPVVLALPVATP